MNELKIKLKKHKQEHLLKYYDELNQNQQKHLINQIKTIDFDLINKLYFEKDNVKEYSNISNMKSNLTNQDYLKAGEESIKQGEYAVVTMAGGQGTRLGHSGPKGTYILGYNINKSLFEIQSDKLKNIYNNYKIYTPWYIMTSNSNHDETIKFFKEKNYFDYPQDKITFFKQQEIPMLTKEGKIVMDSKHNIKMGANGSGGVFSSLSIYLDKLKEEGVKWLFIGGIDNILLPIDNPNLLGFAIHEDYLAASKIIKKAYPLEKVGVFAKVNNIPSVIEYIHMTYELNHLTDKDNNLVYGDSHILCNLFNIDILFKIKEQQLPYTGVLKPTEYLNDEGKIETVDAYKFECFVFDAFTYVSEVGLLEGKREEVFAPIKNKEGIDSPESASKLYNDYYKNN